MSFVVDIHSHFYPDWFVDWFRGRREVPRVAEEEDGARFLLFTTEEGEASGPLLTPEYTTIEAKLDFMKRNGIDCSIVSLGNPWFEVFEPDRSLRLVEEANARLSGLAGETSGKIVGMGALPNADPENVAAVIESVAADPGLRGVISSTTIGGLLLDDRRLDPVWESLVSTRTPLMIHPMMTCVPTELSGYGIALSAGIGFPFKTTIALARLLLGGVIERHRGLRLVAAHGGGALPFLIGRLEGTHRPGSDDHHLHRLAKKLIFDATLYEPGAVRMAVDLVGPSRVLFGTDHPFSNADAPRTWQAIVSALPVEQASAVVGGAATEWYDINEALDRWGQS